MGYKVAVVGATGNVGTEMMNILHERGFPVDELVPLASSRSVGREVMFGDKTLKCQNLDDYDFTGTTFAFSSPGAKVSAQYAPRAASQGCYVIDNTSQFRMDPDIPLVVPEVNPQALREAHKTKIIANPNCSTIQMVVALKPIHARYKIKRVVVSTYQSVSGSGREAMDELFHMTKNVYVNQPTEPEVYTKPIAFNCIPHIDVFMDDGATKEEWKMKVETKKILDPAIKVHANCVRVPVFISHAEMVNIETELPIDEAELREYLREEAEGLVVLDIRDDGGYVTQKEAAGEDAVYVSRIRQDDTVDNGVSMWVVADNLRKGAALNTVQIAEKMIEMGLV